MLWGNRTKFLLHGKFLTVQSHLIRILVVKKKITLITSIMGDYDQVPPIPEGFHQAVLVSDSPVESEWTNVVLKSGLPPRLAAKIPKFRPDLFVTSEYSVWVDASLRDQTGWLKSASQKSLKFHDFVLFQHPDRSSVADEIIASRQSPKYDAAPLENQLAHYVKEGFKDDLGLWACGVIARKHTRNVIDFGNAWLVENMAWTIQDQISLPYLVWQRHFSVGKFPEHLWDGPLNWAHHNRPFE
jgi:hypothetical protein